MGPFLGVCLLPTPSCQPLFETSDFIAIPARLGVSQTCLGANVLSGLVPSTVFKKNLWAFLGPCVRGRGRPSYGTSAQPESHFTCSSPRGSPQVVPSTSLLNYFWAFLVTLGRGGGGGPSYSTFAKPRTHFTEGMFEKR